MNSYQRTYVTLRPLVAGASGFARVEQKPDRVVVQFQGRGLARHAAVEVCLFADTVYNAGRCPVNVQGLASLSTEATHAQCRFQPEALTAVFVTSENYEPLLIGLCAHRSANELLAARNAMLAYCARMSDARRIPIRASNEPLAEPPEVAAPTPSKSEGLRVSNEREASLSSLTHKESLSSSERPIALASAEHEQPLTASEREEVPSLFPSESSSETIYASDNREPLQALDRREATRSSEDDGALVSPANPSKPPEREADAARLPRKALSDTTLAPLPAHASLPPIEVFLPAMDPSVYIPAEHPRRIADAAHAAALPAFDSAKSAALDTPSVCAEAVEPAADAVAALPHRSSAPPIDRLPALRWPSEVRELRRYFSLYPPFAPFDAVGWRFVRVPMHDGCFLVGYLEREGVVRQIAYAIEGLRDVPPPPEFSAYRFVRGRDLRGYWAYWQDVGA